MDPSFQDNRRGLNTQEIRELRDQGITVDDNDKALPKNAADKTSSNITLGQWKDLRHCECEAFQTNSKLAGNWKSHAWSQIRNMSALQLWMMCLCLKAQYGHCTSVKPIFGE